MTQRDDLDQLLSAWLDDPYTPPAPQYLGQVLERTRHTRQRPAWANLERWLPMAEKISGTTAAPPLRMARLLLIALLVLALAAAAAFVGSRLLSSSPAIPQGGAAVLAFASQEGGDSGSPVGDLYTVMADGTDLRQLTSVSRASGLDEAPVWSPDGTRIAFRGYHSLNNTVEVIDAGGGNRTMLWKSSAARDPYCAEHDDLAWSLDGQTVVFAAHAACPGQPDLFVVPFDGSAPADKLLAPGTIGVHPRFSPNGRQIAFQGSEGGASGLYVADVGSAGVGAGGLQARRIGPDLEGSTTEQWFAPQWSPDGTELAVSIGFETGQIVVVKADGSGQRVLATDEAFNATWSPDGKRIAFHRIVDESERFLDRPCTMRIWVMNTDGSDERRLDPLVDGCVLPPIWSPDGTRLLGLVIADQAFHVGVLTADGNDPPVVFLESYGASWQPVAAPLPPAPSFPAASAAP